MHDETVSKEQLLRELERLNERVAALEAAEVQHKHGSEEMQHNAELAAANEQLIGEIAEREKARDILRDSQALYSSLVDNLPVHVVRKDLEGRFVFANRSFCEFLGKPLAEILGYTDFDLFPAKLAEKFRQDDRVVVETGRLLASVAERKKDDEARFMELLKSPVRDAAGQIVGVQVVLWDVTDRHDAEVALEYERYLLKSLMDNLPYSIYFKDEASRFTRINKALADYFHLQDAEEAIGKTDFDFFTEEHARQAMNDEQEIIRTRVPMVDKEEKETWPDGHVTWAMSTKMPLYDEQGRIVGTMGISRDITERINAAKALKCAKEAAESANRAKSTFLANMSHEIRTPLNGVIGMTELVLKTPLTPQQREFLVTVKDSGEALLTVINDILDFSKIEAGKLALDCKTFDLRESLGDTMKSFAIRAHQQGLELACFIEPDVPRFVVGDYNRLRQIIINLLGNAIKFTATGEVSLEAIRETATENNVELHFIVSDTGIGIPPEKRSTIFEMFEQGDTSITRRHGGTGLGLAIASRLIALMGGRIWVESEVGRGSRFHFTVHLGLPAGETVEPIPPEPAVLHGMRVLVVDDNATNRRILCKVLGGWSMTPATASNAGEALRMLQEAQQYGDPFRLVLSDAHMPNIDGFTLARQIKQDAAFGSTVVMMLTSGDRQEDVERCEELGIAAYLLKPVKQSELLEAIEVALGIIVPKAEMLAPVPLVPRKPAGNYRLLLAEDSLVNQKLAVALLEGEGYKIQVVQNGREAVAAVESSDFDLILMDVQMPEMDGLEATARIRARERHTGKHVPIVAMTAYALKGDRERFLASGMDAYIAKPIRANELFETVGALLGADGESASSPSISPCKCAVADWTEALRAVRGDRHLLRIIVETAAQEIPNLMTTVRAAMTEAMAGGDASKLRLAAHTLKGSMHYFASGPVVEHAHRLEKMGEARNFSGATEALAVLEADVAQLTPVLSDYLRQCPEENV